MGITRSEFKKLTGRELEEVLVISPGKPQEPKAKAKKIPRGMNKAERTYSEHLRMLIHIGEIISFKFEAVSFDVGIGDNGRARWYTPDFMVTRQQIPDALLRRPTVEFHEVKGDHRGRERGIARFEAAKKLYPMFNWVLVDLTK